MYDLEALRKACKIAAEAREYGKSLIKPGASLLDVTEKIEAKIFDLGGFLAFPSQISFNEQAAHNYPSFDDKTVFKEQLVKLDIGVHIDGNIADTACTIDLSGKHEKLVKASVDAVDAAIRVIHPEITLAEVGKAIEAAISAYGYNPVKNLCGHGLGEYQVHLQPSVPNYDNKSPIKLKKGQLIAIEPFATLGVGFIEERGDANVFMMIKKGNARDLIARQILNEIKQYNDLPFAKRWLVKKFPINKLDYGLRILVRDGLVKEYPPLVEKSNGLVSQHEHTIIVDETPEVLTRV